MVDDDFATFESTLGQHGVEAALELLATRLRARQQYHELFEALKFQLRQRMGMPLVPVAGETANTSLSEAYEQGLIAACREVGMSLLAKGRLREAWMYLRPVGDNAAVLAVLNDMTVPDERLDEVIEVCLYEGLDPVRAFRLMLDKYGTCNTLTTFDAQQHGLDRSTRQQVAELLVRHLHEQLLQNVRSHVTRHEGNEPMDGLATIVQTREWLLVDGNYHIDVSHLASTVRAAKTLVDPTTLRLAWELADYGGRLEESLQYADEEPFADIYRAHRHYFEILLGENQDAGLDYFRQRATNIDAHYAGTGPIEIYVDLLLRVGRGAEAFAFALEHLPPGTHTRGIAPPLLEIARAAGQSDAVATLFRQRGDFLGFAAALLQRAAT